MKVSELIGGALDYWVGRVYTLEGLRLDASTASYINRQLSVGTRVPFSPSTEWAQGGPIIDVERIALWHGSDEWFATHPVSMPSGYGADSDYIDVTRDESFAGATPLIAAMRAFVGSRLGQEVPDVPPSKL